MGYIGDGPKPELEVGDISTKDVTATGDVTISDKIIHSGDTNTAIRFAAADTVTVETAGSERARFDSSGQVGIGTTPVRKLHIHESGSNAHAYIHMTNAATGATTTDGFSILTSGTASGRVTFIQRENQSMLFSTNATERMRILAGGGLTFNGDTAAANALDDYDEGTWTPSIQQGWTSTSGTFNGRYTKIGNLVNAFYFIQFSGTNAGAHVRISGLPFTSVNETDGALRGGALTYFTAPVDSAGMVLTYVIENSTEFRLYAGNDGGASTLSNGNATNNYFIGSVIYRAA